ncbi:MAG: peptidase, partial [Planctomycetota bacterium]
MRTDRFLRFAAMIVGMLACGVFTAQGLAQKIRLKDGRVLSGKTVAVTGVADSLTQSPGADADAPSTPIRLVDDDLRRVFVPNRPLPVVVSQVPEKMVRIDLSKWQNVARSGGAMGSVGPSLGITAFDKWGRRIYEMQTSNGPLAVVQGITELTPRYAKVEGLRGQPRSIVWDMRIATSSIPRDVLAAILDNAIDRSRPQDWLQIVRFYLEAERYRDARRELEALIQRFPEEADQQAQVKLLRQLGAQRILKEIQLRSDAGQHQLVDQLLDNFPAEEVAGETLQQVRETIEQYAANQAKLRQVRELLKQLVKALDSTEQQELIAPIIEEILSDLSRNNLARLIPFLQLADDESLTAEQRVALAITGWLLGADGASQEFSLALSVVQVRTSVLQYLREPLAHKRLTLLQSIESAEGASVPDVAKLIANLKPPWEVPTEAIQPYGVCELMAPGQTEHGDFRYLVQLPPEYDPYRRYPTLLVLNGAYNSPEQELSFWAGAQPRDAEGNFIGGRKGQAMRRGYITIAVQWLKRQQYRYEYSLREHEAVLATLRDATRRFSVDTDRVFLAGHGVGGDAAWDLAQAHPDLWAGVIPFVAKRDPVKKYIQFYWENSAFVPLYFVAGEKDGLKMSLNASLWDEYLTNRFDTTIVEYLGRGQEPFHDEILHIFDWMALPNHRRLGSPKEFTCSTMRPWDNFFW